MPLTTDELLADLPDAIRLYATIKAAAQAAASVQPVTAVAIGTAIAAVAPELCALIDKLVAQAKT